MIVLWANKQAKIPQLGNNVEVDNGALVSAPNSERKAYFTYASFIISLVTLALIPITITAMILYLVTQGLSFGLILCMPMLISVFISNKLSQKATQCNQEKFLVEFSRQDLLGSLIKYFTLTSIMVGTMMWLASTH